uniref:Putative cellulosomal scaffoldin protein n=1 Tax=Ruminococcus flavefaciens TaxID=1265 RepID=A6H5D0_RUMFL|nr:putative cellulosomal scaffoldin protein precursor [Ruminococcus flavefaciens]
MKKFISAVTSLALAASMASVAAPVSYAADATKTLTIGAYKESGSEYATQGSNVTISKDAIAAGSVKVPCAVYLNEDTADTQTMAIPITINSTNADVKNVKFELSDPAKPYFDTAKTITTAKGETITTKNAVVFAAGLDEMDDYAVTGILNLTVDSKQEKAGADNYYIGWGQNFPRGYSWTGSKSDDYPVFVFDVIFPQGTAAGDYKIQFCNYIKDSQGNAALMLETENARYANIGTLSNLTLNEMTITVGEGSTPGSSTTTTSTTTSTVTTSSTSSKDVGDADIVLDFGTYEGQKGGKVTVEAKLQSGATKPCGSYDVKFKIDSPLSITAYGSTSPAYGSASIENNKETMQASFICMDTNSDPLAGTEGETVFKFSVSIPDTCPDGIYNVGLASAEIFKGGKNSDTWTWATVNGTIKVGEPGTTSTTTTTTTTTTSTTSTTSTTQPPTNPGDPLYGDANCDNVVNIADVVVLNKWINDNGSYDLTEQGKKNADCYNPQGGADITAADSTAIIKSIVHQDGWTLPVQG